MTTYSFLDGDLCRGNIAADTAIEQITEKRLPHHVGCCMIIIISERECDTTLNDEVIRVVVSRFIALRIRIRHTQLMK